MSFSPVRLSLEGQDKFLGGNMTWIECEEEKMKWIEISQDTFVKACCFLKKSAEGDMYPCGWYLEYGEGRYRAEGNGKGAIFYYKLK